jgi:hypothetical protein
MKSISTLNSLSRVPLAVNVVITAMVGVAANAQAQSQFYVQQTAPSTQPMKAVEWNGRSVAPTGAAVPNPGSPKIGLQTEIERRAQERSARAIRTICTGCLVVR